MQFIEPNVDKWVLVNTPLEVQRVSDVSANPFPLKNGETNPKWLTHSMGAAGGEPAISLVLN